ncbi:MAG: hypothetical protein ABF384_16675 [Verrucomicrobiales bacterium]
MATLTEAFVHVGDSLRCKAAYLIIISVNCESVALGSDHKIVTFILLSLEVVLPNSALPSG